MTPKQTVTTYIIPRRTVILVITPRIRATVIIRPRLIVIRLMPLLQTQV